MVIRYCSVFKCGQKGPTDECGNKVTYHLVPSGQPQRNLWIKRIRRRDYLYNSVCSIFVCSRHFNEEDFVKDLPSNRRRLLDGVLPSNFAWELYEKGSNTETSGLMANMNKLEVSSDNIEPTTGNIPTKSKPDQLESSSNNDEEGINQVIENNSLEALNSSKLENINIKYLLEEKERLKELVRDLESKLYIKDEEINKLQSYLKNVEKLLEDEKGKNKMLEAKLKKTCISIEAMKDHDEDIRFYTGMPNYKSLMSLFEFLNPGPNGENIVQCRGKNSQSKVKSPQKLPVMDQFLIVLMRLRLGLFERDLAHRFGVSKSLINVTCISWIKFMYLQLGQVDIWPSRQNIDACMPQEFKEDYPTTRVIIDATEIKCQVPKSQVLQSHTYSNYKSFNTYKSLIGISPTGYVTFVSALFSGSISDKELIKKSGLLGMDFSPNDSIMADKGFLINDVLEEINVNLNIPPFLNDKGQFTEADVAESQKIAKRRIHIEKRFHIFDRPIPVTLSPVINQLWTVAALLTNFQNPLVNTWSGIPAINDDDDDDLNDSFYNDLFLNVENLDLDPILISDDDEDLLICNS